MKFFSPDIYQPRQSEMGAASAELAATPYLPDNLDITVFYGGHDEVKDFKALEPYISQTDIFVPEITAWGMDELKLFSRISQGDKQARNQLEQEFTGGRFTRFTAAETKWLQGSGIFVTSIDYAASHERASEILSHFENWGLMDKIVPNYRKTLGNIASFAAYEAELEELREYIMIHSVGPRLDAIISGEPTLESKGRIKVLIQQGTAHTYFFHELVDLARDNASVNVRRVFDDKKPILFEHFDRLTRSYRTGIELSSEETEELAMRALARLALRFNGIPFVIEETDYVNGRLRMPHPEVMVDRFSPDAIKAFHTKVVNARSRR